MHELHPDAATVGGLKPLNHLAQGPCPREVTLQHLKVHVGGGEAVARWVEFRDLDRGLCQGVQVGDAVAAHAVVADQLVQAVLNLRDLVAGALGPTVDPLPPPAEQAQRHETRPPRGTGPTVRRLVIEKGTPPQRNAGGIVEVREIDLLNVCEA